MFENLAIGPTIGIEEGQDINYHLNDMLNQGLIPMRVITDKEDELYQAFVQQIDMKSTQAVIFTIYYKENYE